MPAMTLTAERGACQARPGRRGVSYGHRYHTAAETTLALVPLGYADGVPRHATNVGEVWIAGRRRHIAGTVCMDQFVVDVGDDPVYAGGRVRAVRPGDDGEPTAQDWAEAIGTINYEIVTRVGPRVPRRYVGGDLRRRRVTERSTVAAHGGGRAGRRGRCRGARLSGGRCGGGPAGGLRHGASDPRRYAQRERHERRRGDAGGVRERTGRCSLRPSSSPTATRALPNAGRRRCRPRRRAASGRPRIVLYDQRGHGASGAGGPRGDDTIEQLGRDLVRGVTPAGAARARSCSWATAWAA